MQTKFMNLGVNLSRLQQKQLVGGEGEKEGESNKCNKGCSSNAGCDTTCPSCEENTNWDNAKICVK